MKKATALVTFILSCNVMALAQSSAHFGAWSVYSGHDRNGKIISLLQTNSIESTGAQLEGATALKLDVVCRNGKLTNVALETTAPVARKAMNWSAVVPTTPVSFTADQTSTEVQNWAVLDSGHTISPYSEARQGKRNRAWVESVSGAGTLVLDFQGENSEEKIQGRFHTTGIAEALASMGCSY